jgi:Na+-transporting methylmalonyl-CoA/oxaloacetate decarboxylase gamma subunit
MGDPLSEALRYTLIGMGMTFAAIGALVVGMYLLTALAPGREAEETPEARVGGAAPEPQAGNDRHRAAVAAVAVALAEASRARSPRGIRPGAADRWTTFVRSQHLKRGAPHRRSR